MESIINNRMCRCCASEGTFKDVKTLYYWMGVEEVYADMLRECFDIDLTCVEAGEHGGICEVCITQLRNASNFKKQVLQTEDHFKKFLESSDKFFKTKIIKEEGVSKYDNLEDDDVGAPVLDSDNGSDDYPLADLEIKQEYKDELKTRKRTAKAGSSKAKKSKKDGESTSKQIHDISENESKITLNKKNFSFIINIMPESVREKSKKHKNKTKVQVKKKLVELDYQIENVETLLRFSNATPVDFNHNTWEYNCAYCQNSYTNPKSLKTHTKNHTDEPLPYLNPKTARMTTFQIKMDITALECKLCDEKQTSLDEMFNHLKSYHNQTVHLDIRNHIIPFRINAVTNEYSDCAICYDDFGDFNKIVEHMSQHLKNYICDFCDLPFITRAQIIEHKRSVHNLDIRGV